MFNQAESHFDMGEYKQAIAIYDKVLEVYPNDAYSMRMKGIAYSLLEDHANSLKQFYKILQYRPDSVLALTGLGVGFGYLGEYEESMSYLKMAEERRPDSVIIKNYNEFVQRIITKYPYTPTEKPQGLDDEHPANIPPWIKPIARWWSEKSINDAEFVAALQHLIDSRVVQVPPVETQDVPERTIPQWVAASVRQWSDQESGDDGAFVLAVQQIIKSGLISAGSQETYKTQEELDNEFYLFEKYLRSVSNNISKEKRYIEHPNPSQDVIKKFLRDYVVWNFEEEVKTSSSDFPNPTYETIDGVHVIYYKVYVNDQPTGLPLDHVSTLKDSFKFWESKEMTISNQNARVKFEITGAKHEANVWVTWVVRNLGEGVLGHAHLGKGVVEVALGDYTCSGSFQLYDVNSVKTIMTHELGHSIGLHHSDDPKNIMYPSYQPSYAYCLLSLGA